MSDNSNSDTEADEQTVAELKERIGELEERVEQQEAQRGTSRRQFLGSLTGIASAGAAGYYLGAQRASAAPNWGAATGQMGTESKPYQQVISNTGTFQSVSTDGVDYNGLTPDYPHYQFDHTEEKSNQTTTSTSYTDVLSYMGVFFPGDIPQNSTLYGRFAARIKNDTLNETTSVQPRVFDEGAGGWQNLAALELSATVTSLTFVDSGWTDISADIPNPGNLHRIPMVQMKVTAGTGKVGYNNTVLYLAGSVQ